MSMEQFEYEVERAMYDQMYRVEVSLRDAELAIARLRAEYEAMVGRLNESATRPTKFGNAEFSPI